MSSVFCKFYDCWYDYLCVIYIIIYKNNQIIKNMKNKIFLLMSLVSFSFLYCSNKNFEKQSDQFDQAEKLVIDYYSAKNKEAIESYNKLIHLYKANLKQFMQVKSSGYKSLCDAKIAEQKILYPWGFQWLAALVVKNNLSAFCKNEIKPSDKEIDLVVKNYLAGMIGNQIESKKVPNNLTDLDTACDSAIACFYSDILKKPDVSYYKTNDKSNFSSENSNNWINPRGLSVSEKINDLLELRKKKQVLLVPDYYGKPLLLRSKIYHSMMAHKRNPQNYNYDDLPAEEKQKFCKNFMERREEEESKDLECKNWHKNKLQSFSHEQILNIFDRLEDIGLKKLIWW